MENLSDGHRRLGLVANGHIGEGDGRKRQQPCIGVAAHLDGLADDPARLGFKGGAVTAPVDEIGRDQRCEQRQDQQTTDGDEYTDQFSILPAAE